MSNEISVLESVNLSTGSLVLSSEKMNSIFNVANMMSKGVSTVPKHLQGNPADCMAIIIQATQWNMNPFAVAQKTHVISGTLGYEAQLVNAVVSTSGAITSKFKYEYQGTGVNMSCRVGAILKGEDYITWNEYLCINDITVKNSPLWKTNPKQQIAYLQVKNWARLYAPECILGVYSTDELDTSRYTNKKQEQVAKIQSDAQKAYGVESEAGYTVQDLKKKFEEYLFSEQEMRTFVKMFGIDKTDNKTFTDVIDNFNYYVLLQKYKEYDISEEMINKFNNIFGVIKTDPNTFTDIIDSFDDYFDKFQAEIMNSEEIEVKDE